MQQLNADHDSAVLASIFTDISDTLDKEITQIRQDKNQINDISQRHCRLRMEARKRLRSELEEKISLVNSDSEDVNLTDLQKYVFCGFLEPKVLTNDVPFEEMKNSLLKQIEEKEMILSTLPTKEESDIPDKGVVAALKNEVKKRLQRRKQILNQLKDL
eukprot:PhF_6_TR1460/c0_g1_i1/m.2627